MKLTSIYNCIGVIEIVISIITLYVSFVLRTNLFISHTTTIFYSKLKQTVYFGRCFLRLTSDNVKTVRFDNSETYFINFSSKIFQNKNLSSKCQTHDIRYGLLYYWWIRILPFGVTLLQNNFGALSFIPISPYFGYRSFTDIVWSVVVKHHVQSK